MQARPVSTILEEWRTLERELHESMDAATRIDIERAVAALADEHRAAVDAQQPHADGLGASPAMGAAEP